MCNALQQRSELRNYALKRLIACHRREKAHLQIYVLSLCAVENRLTVKLNHWNVMKVICLAQGDKPCN